jgi:hypothetical protein
MPSPNDLKRRLNVSELRNLCVGVVIVLAGLVALFLVNDRALASGLKSGLYRYDFYPDLARPATNLVPNPSFEDGTTSPTGWIPCGNNVQTVWDNTVAHTGSYSVSGGLSNFFSYCFWTSSLLSVPAGNYYFGFWHREAFEAQNAQVNFQCAGGNILIAAPAYSDGTWHYYEIPLTLDSVGCGYDGTLQIGLPGSSEGTFGAGTVWYDDLYLGTTPNNDTQPPSINWVAPVADQQVYSGYCDSSPLVNLEVSVADYGSGLDRVEFWRWDAVNTMYVYIATDQFSNPTTNTNAAASIGICDLNTGWNEIIAYAYDKAGNWISRYIWINRTPPPPNGLLLLQTDSPWQGDTYGNYLSGDSVNTIYHWGCFLTSAAMVINYYASLVPTTFRTDPRALNSWLRTRGGYNPSNLVEWPALLQYANENGVPLAISNHDDVRNDTMLDAALNSGDLAILGVNNSGHYVVAIGKSTANGWPDYNINDPLYGRTTIFSQYYGTYSSVLTFSNSTDKRIVTVSPHSPVDLLVEDPNGLFTGYDPQTGTSWNQIPRSEYFTNTLAPDGGSGLGTNVLKSKMFWQLQPLNAQYGVEVLGYGSGSYQLWFSASNLNGIYSKITQSGIAYNRSVEWKYFSYNSQTGLYRFSLLLPLITN